MKYITNILSIAVLLMCHAFCMAQDYNPTTNWPYVNADFQPGVIHLADSTYSQASLNIHLNGNVLQCVNGSGNVSVVVFPNIDHVTIGDAVYRYVNDRLMQVLHADGTDFVALSVDADFDDMLRNNMPYGIAGRTISTMNTKLLNLRGESNERYADMRKTWYDGQSIPLNQRFFFMIDNSIIAASMKGCSTILTPVQRKQLKAFTKAEDIDWRKPEDVIKVFNELRRMQQ